MKRCVSLVSVLTGIISALPSSAGAKRVAPPVVVSGGGHALIAQSSCDEAGDRVLDWAAYSAVQSHFGYQWRYLRGAEMDAAAPSAAKGEGRTAGAAGPGNYTKTNVQERGVDEPDMVKTDGKFVYTVSGREVIIARSWPASSARVVARYELPAQVTPQQLFLAGDRLVVLSYVYEQASASKGDRIAAPHHGTDYFYGTRMTVLDIADRARPRVMHEADVEGWMAQARMIGDDVYLVSNASMNIPARILEKANARAAALAKEIGLDDHSRLEKARERAFRTVRADLERRFGGADLTSAMPRERHRTGRGAMGAFKPLYACQDLLVPRGGSQLGTLNLVHFDIDRPADLDSIGLMASGWTIYASADALYAAMPTYGWRHFWGWGADIAPESSNTTHIHKFELGGEKPRYVASGSVRGHLNNQFSMSEHRGHLRVATTDQAWGWGGERTATGNHLYVLATRGGRLRQVGAIEDLAKGERIYAARMMGDKGYMVTFRQTDPLFTLDLSDPQRPRVAGELKINGFSSYIHPLDGDHLLTIGQDADDDGRVLGVHVQVFDVSNPARPRRSAHKRLANRDGWSWSAAQWDHHAFTYDPRTGVLGVPMSNYSNDPEKTFLGLVLLQVSKDGFETLGRINHTALARIARERECSNATDESNWQCRQDVHQDWRSQIQRSIVMDETIFTISQLGMQANDIARPGRPIAQVVFARKPVAVAR
ncbi:MAG TPA: beta-propeller domain-containing protein [Kofleriaceae bacterium]|nr:beta-propeller domain-containing protein [Kofleriaceae bacterium]